MALLFCSTPSLFSLSDEPDTMQRDCSNTSPSSIDQDFISNQISMNTNNNNACSSDALLDRLPVEILGLILEQLTKQDIVECMSVSAAWRDQFACCSAPWREIIMTHKEQIHAISPWITTVHHFVKDMSFSCENIWIFTKAMSWITDGYLPHLCSLQIYSEYQHFIYQ